MSRAQTPVVVLCGPTAVGKTALAVALGGEVGGEVIGADSRQIYVGMDVGTAKPTAEERAAVPHHLVDVVDPSEDFDAGRFRALALKAIEDVRARGKVPLVVGGSGFYLRALLHGLPDLPEPDASIRAAVRDELERCGSAAMHAELARIDPVSATRLHPNDAVRIARALEVHRQTGRPLSSFASSRAVAGPVVRVVVDRPREELDRRIEERTRAMWSGGFVEEVRALWNRPRPPAAQALNALGYREILDHLERGARLDGEQAHETIARITLATRRFVRRQRAWFRPEGGIAAAHPERDVERILSRVQAALEGGHDRPVGSLVR